MKKSIFLLMLAVAAFFTSCREEVDRAALAEPMYIYFANEEIESDHPEARVVVDYSEWIMIEVTNNGCEHKDGISFYFVNKFDAQCILVYATPKALVFAEMTNSSGTYLLTDVPDQVTLVTETDEGYRISSVTAQGQSFEATKEIILPRATSTRKMPQSHTEDYMSAYRKMIYDKMTSFFDATSDGVNAITGPIGIVNESVSMVGTIWTVFALPAAQRSIYLGNPEMMEELKEEIEARDNEFISTHFLPGAGTVIGKTAYRLIMNLTPLGSKLRGKSYADESDYTPGTYLPMFSSSRMADPRYYKPMNEYAEMYPKYTVNAYLDKVGETTAQIHGSYSCNDGSMSYISSMGYECYANGSRTPQTVTVDNLHNFYQLEGLQPFTYYQVIAFVKSFGATYYSKPISFTTDGDMHPSPTSLHFSADGGTETVALNIPSTLASQWKISSAPKWCSIKSKGGSMEVTVGETGKERSGTITVVLEVKGMTKSASITVQQDGPKDISKSWDGTKWKFDHSRFGFSTTFVDMANNDWSCSGYFNSSYNMLDMVELSNGDLELLAIDAGGYSTGSSFALYSYEYLITFHRTGLKTATATIDYTLNNDGKVEKGKVTIKGQLIQ